MNVALWHGCGVYRIAPVPILNQSRFSLHNRYIGVAADQGAMERVG